MCRWQTLATHYQINSVEVTFSLYMHYTYHIPSSVGFSAPKLINLRQRDGYAICNLPCIGGQQWPTQSNSEPTKSRPRHLKIFEHLFPCCHLYSKGVDKGGTRGAEAPPSFEVHPIE